MVNIPIRQIGEMGVIPDYNDHDLPLKAWNDAINLRFDRGFVSRYSVFRHFDSTFDFSDVSAHITGVLEAGGSETDGCLIGVMSDGTLRQRLNGVTTTPTQTGSLGYSVLQPTTTKLSGVTYLNRSADIPCYRENPSDGAFSGWRYARFLKRQLSLPVSTISQ